MRFPKFFPGHAIWRIIAFILLLVSPALCADTTNDDNARLGERVHQLLETRDADRFAAETAASLADWRSAYPTNAIAPAGIDLSDAALEQRSAAERSDMANTARKVLEQAAKLGLDPARVRFRVKEVTVQTTGFWQSAGAKLPWANEGTVILIGEPVRNIPADQRLRGEYELALDGVLKFAGGLRLSGGVVWKRFPDGVADEQTARDLKLAAKVGSHGASLNTNDDPSLAVLGNALIPFIQQRDEKIFADKAVRTFDEAWQEFQKYKDMPGQKMPSQKEVNDAWTGFQARIMASARAVLDQSAQLGLDFTNAHITLKDVAAANPSSRGMGIDAGATRFVFSVETDRKSRAGRPLAGDYVLTASRLHRGDSRWTIEDTIRWEKFPDGIVDGQAQVSVDFENYVAEHMALPPGTAAPDAEFTQIADGKKSKISDYRGQVVVLEFWATWCGPCQEPMAHLQTLSQENPAWKDKVRLISLSIDDNAKLPQDHLAKHGWTNTFNTWAGAGAFESAPGKQYRLKGVPTMYVIDPAGKIVWSGHPAGAPLPQIVNGFLK